MSFFIKVTYVVVYEEIIYVKMINVGELFKGYVKELILVCYVNI